MKFIIVLFVIQSALLCQSIDSNIANLKIDRLRLENLIKSKTDSLEIVKNDLDKYIMQKKLIELKGKNSIKVVCKSKGEIRKENSMYSDILFKTEINDTLILLDYCFNEKFVKENSWLVKKDEHIGYVFESILSETEDIILFRENIIKEKQENEINFNKKKKQEYKKFLTDKFGKNIGEDLFNGYYWVGMTVEMVSISLGNPNNINKTVGDWGIHEQWVYSNLYLYFENGILTSYQNSK